MEIISIKIVLNNFMLPFYSIDFWLVKNLSGRLLAGLRWWNVVVIVDKQDNSNANANANANATVVAVVKKRFECRDRRQRESSPILPSQVQKRQLLIAEQGCVHIIHHFLYISVRPADQRPHKQTAMIGTK